MQHKPFPLFPLCKSYSLSTPQFVGDQQTICYLRSFDGNSHIMRQDLESGLADTVTAEQSPTASVGYGGASFTCNRQSLAFAAKDKKLYQLDWEIGLVRAITPAFEGLAAPTLSPCGNFIAFLGENSGHCNVYLVDRRGRQLPLKVSRDPWYAFNPVFSPDGNRLAWIEWDRAHMPWDESRIMVADFSQSCFQVEDHFELKPRAIRSLAKSGVSFSSPQFSPDGRLLAFTSDQSGWRSLWIAPADGSDDGERIDTGVGEVGGPDWVAGLFSLRWHANSQSLYGLQIFQSRSRLFKVNWPSKAVKPIDLPHSEISEFDIDGDSLAYIGSHPHRPSELITMSLEEHKPVVRASAKIGLIPQSTLSTPEFCQWRSSQNSEAYGVFYPCLQRENKPAPLIVHIHGGPTSQTMISWRPEAHYFTSRGYHFLAVNHRGSTGFGRAYQDLQKGRWGVVDIEDARSGAATLIERGLVDPQQVVIMGGSAGGYTTLMALVKQPDFWAGGIALYGISSLYELEINSHRFEINYNHTLVGPLPAAGKLWVERSPLTYMSQLQAPVLLFHGTDDKAVPYQQSLAFCQAAKARGQICELVTFEGEGHGFKKEQHKKILFRKIEAFLHKYILCKQVH